MIRRKTANANATSADEIQVPPSSAMRVFSIPELLDQILVNLNLPLHLNLRLVHPVFNRAMHPATASSAIKYLTWHASVPTPPQSLQDAEGLYCSPPLRELDFHPCIGRLLENLFKEFVLEFRKPDDPMPAFMAPAARDAIRRAFRDIFRSGPKKDKIWPDDVLLTHPPFHSIALSGQVECEGRTSHTFWYVKIDLEHKPVDPLHSRIPRVVISAPGGVTVGHLKQAFTHFLSLLTKIRFKQRLAMPYNSHIALAVDIRVSDPICNIVLPTSIGSPGGYLPPAIFDRKDLLSIDRREGYLRKVTTVELECSRKWKIEVIGDPRTSHPVWGTSAWQRICMQDKDGRRVPLSVGLHGKPY
ncbi:hypothetical protein ABW19_dt0206963 [Dactylella cylindrospora]|nr:hypothetical protein ABW19_dt0206963 [Dactylella cylindrospora]